MIVIYTSTLFQALLYLTLIFTTVRESDLSYTFEHLVIKGLSNKTDSFPLHLTLPHFLTVTPTAFVCVFLTLVNTVAMFLTVSPFPLINSLALQVRHLALSILFKVQEVPYINVATQVVIDSLSTLPQSKLTSKELSIGEDIHPLSFKGVIGPVPSIYVPTGVLVDPFPLFHLVECFAHICGIIDILE